MNYEKALKELSRYGQVLTCKIVNDSVLTIVLGKGFSTNAVSSFGAIKTCTDLFPDYKNIETMITDNDLAIFIFTKQTT